MPCRGFGGVLVGVLGVFGGSSVPVVVHALSASMLHRTEIGTFLAV